jgi:hypothetical protein
MKPIYNGKIKRGRVVVVKSGMSKKVKSFEIGRQDSPSENALLDILIHEELEARIAVRANRRWGSKFDEMLEKDTKRHAYIYQVIARYFRMRGWK